MNAYGGQLELGLTQARAASGNDFDLTMDFVSDSIWTLGDITGCPGVFPTLPALKADEPSTGASDNLATTLPTLLGFEGLPSAGLDELVKI